MSGLVEAWSRKRNQPAPPHVVFDDLCNPHRQPVRPWLLLQDDEIEPAITESDHPNHVVWSSIWTARPDAVLRFDLDPVGGGTDLRWTLLLEEPLPDERVLRHMRHRIGELINANLRFTYGQ